MKTINAVFHITANAKNIDTFAYRVNQRIDEIQKDGLEVEVQYQQSDSAVSVLILGRMEKGGE